MPSSPQCAQLDPENRLLWHMPPRRLDFESMRDALQFVAGTLDLTVGGPPVDVFTTKRRTIYGYIDRLNVQALLRTFDVPSPDATSPQRDVTTVPAQALYLMNSAFTQQSSKLLAQRPDIAGETDFVKRLNQLYQVVYARIPRPDEKQLAEEYFGTDSAQRIDPVRWQRFAHALLLTNEFAFVD